MPTPPSSSSGSRRRQHRPHASSMLLAPSADSAVRASSTHSSPVVSESGEDKMRGWLHKWTNYLKGYQRRWFVLNDGILSYYRNQSEMQFTCRGTIYLSNASVTSLDACHFVIKSGATAMHLKAANEREKQRWINGLELAKSKAAKYDRIFRHADESDESSSSPLAAYLEADNHDGSEQPAFQLGQALLAKLEEVENYYDLCKKHQHLLQKQLNQIGCDSDERSQESSRALEERATVFRVTLSSLINSCRAFVGLARKQSSAWQKTFSNERELRVQLEQMVEQMARQMKHFERSLFKADKEGQPIRHMIPADTPDRLQSDEETSPVTDDEFHDALDGSSSEEIVSMPLPATSIGGPMGEAEALDEESDDEDEDRSDLKPSVLIKFAHPARSRTRPLPSQPTPTTTTTKNRRTKIPPKPDYSINLWGIIKNCVGKDLSRIPVPVNFSEPISMLQRLTEELEYTDLLDHAASLDDNPCKQMAYVAAFTVSAYSTTAERAAKPFNPLLGETYECDRRDDLGWRSIAEQVSHHPPSLSNHAEGRQWTLWQQFTMTSKFRGQYLSIVPLGHSHLLFPKSGNHYTWRKVTTCVQNIIVGKLWIDNVGEMDIFNQKTKDKCHIRYYEYSYFSKEPPRKVMGIVTDSNNIARYVISGKWNEMLECAEVINPQKVTSHSRLDTGNSFVLWKRRYPPAYLASMYNFTELAVQLNETEDGVAPTDSRRRPDQRLMEQGLWDDANREKVRLEEKQRDARRKMEAVYEDGGDDEVVVVPKKEHEPCWFKQQHDPFTNTLMYTFTNEYWTCKEKQDWSRCPDIF